jgi:chromatin remodeling complex protein RSC6
LANNCLAKNCPAKNFAGEKLVFYSTATDKFGEFLASTNFCRTAIRQVEVRRIKRSFGEYQNTRTHLKLR